MIVILERFERRPRWPWRILVADAVLAVLCLALAVLLPAAVSVMLP